jgi:hypothetical protein
MIVIVQDTETQRKLGQLRDLITDLAKNHDVDNGVFTEIVRYAEVGMVPGIRVATEAEAEMIALFGPTVAK